MAPSKPARRCNGITPGIGNPKMTAHQSKQTALRMSMISYWITVSFVINYSSSAIPTTVAGAQQSLICQIVMMIVQLQVGLKNATRMTTLLGLMSTHLRLEGRIISEPGTATMDSGIFTT